MRRLHSPVVLPCDASMSVLRDAVVDVDDDGRIVHWVVTDDVQAKEQQCQLTARD